MIITDTIQIQAPPAHVWDVTTDVEAWPNWAPTFLSVRREDQGPFEVGSSALIRQPGLPEARWTVTSLKPGESFAWETRVRGIHFIGTHQIQPVGAGTESTLQIELRGFLAWLVAPLLLFAAQRSLRQENVSLKARCESAS